MTYKDFDAALKVSSGDRPEFTIAGQKFTCRAKVPWKKFGAMIFALQSGQLPEGETEIGQTEKFFQMVLIKADRQRFSDLLNRGLEEDEDEEDEDIVSAEQMGALTDWLMSHYLGIEKKEESSSPELPAADIVPTKMSLNPVKPEKADPTPEVE